MGVNIPTLATISAAFMAVAAIETIPYSVRGEVIATYASGHADEAGIIVLEENNTRDRSFKTNSSILLSSGNCYNFTVDRSLLGTDRIVDATKLVCPELS